MKGQRESKGGTNVVGDCGGVLRVGPFEVMTVQLRPEECRSFSPPPCPQGHYEQLMALDPHSVPGTEDVLCEHKCFSCPGWASVFPSPLLAFPSLLMG